MNNNHQIDKTLAEIELIKAQTKSAKRNLRLNIGLSTFIALGVVFGTIWIQFHLKVKDVDKALLETQQTQLENSILLLKMQEVNLNKRMKENEQKVIDSEAELLDYQKEKASLVSQTKKMRVELRDGPIKQLCNEFYETAAPFFTVTRIIEKIQQLGKEDLRLVNALKEFKTNDETTNFQKVMIDYSIYHGLKFESDFIRFRSSLEGYIDLVITNKNIHFDGNFLPLVTHDRWRPNQKLDLLQLFANRFTSHDSNEFLDEMPFLSKTVAILQQQEIDISSYNMNLYNQSIQYILKALYFRWETTTIKTKDLTDVLVTICPEASVAFILSSFGKLYSSNDNLSTQAININQASKISDSFNNAMVVDIYVSFGISEYCLDSIEIATFTDLIDNGIKLFSEAYSQNKTVIDSWLDFRNFNYLEAKTRLLNEIQMVECD